MYNSKSGKCFIHDFHRSCIYQWVECNKQTTCPYCRAKIPQTVIDCIKGIIVTNPQDLLLEAIQSNNIDRVKELISFDNIRSVA